MDFMAFQELISKIQGVTNAKVVFEGNELKEVHVISNALRSPKQVVRDIESILLAIYDYKIDRKIISIAQIDTGESRKVGRIIYEGISLGIKDNYVQCEVKLTVDGEEYSSIQRAISTKMNKYRVVAKATVAAVEQVIGQDSIFDVEDIITNNSKDVVFVTVIINMINNFTEDRLLGSAIVRGDINEAIAKATLDAINRKVNIDK